jgi:hypothetical protein
LTDDLHLPAETTRHAIEAAATQLRGRAFLYDDPDAYAAGVRDALSELDDRLDGHDGYGAPAATAEGP